jgi:glycosyltransferase involved in cell wall biosynthesis
VELGVHALDGSEDLSTWERARKQLRWSKHAKFMSTLLENFALCTVVSEVERRLLASAVPGYNAVHVVPNSVSGGLKGEPPQRVPDSLIYTGSLRYGPNHDAVTWFLSEIFPAVRQTVPGARLTITGDPGSLAPPPSPYVVLTGRVPDVRVLLASAAVSLAPIRTGAGTRIKILEAMALRTPVVATSKAMEGIEARHQEHLLIADTPAEFAAAVSQILTDPAAASNMAERAWRLFRDRYDTEVVVPQFLRLVDHAAAAA